MTTKGVEPKGVEPAVIIIFGGTGDLAHRMVLPALHRLAARGKFNPQSHIVTVGRRDIGDQQYRESAMQALQEINASTSASKWFEENLHYRQLAEPDAEHMRLLGNQIAALEQTYHLPGNRVLYLVLPPEAFSPYVEAIGETGLHRAEGWTRIVIEKPFGRDLKSAQALDELLHEYFNEPQIFRIDHYLGKETVQNLLVLRFANPIFENLWNRDHVESVQITVAETLGVENRAQYYETSGALRDMVQNHLTQLLCLIAMEVPGSLSPEAIRDEKVKALRSVAPIRPECVVFGQYQQGQIDGETVGGYREEPGVAADSQTETYAALRLGIDNWRWQGVPFYLRVGKRMPKRLSQIVIQFRRAPVMIFRPYQSCQLHANTLTITLQPDEGFDLCFEVKEPGEDMTVQSESLKFRYAEAFAPLPAAYETLLLDILKDEQTLFVRSDQVEESWRLYDPVLNAPPPIQFYDAGSWGPEAASDLLAKEHSPWMPS